MTFVSWNVSEILVHRCHVFFFSFPLCHKFQSGFLFLGKSRYAITPISGNVLVSVHFDCGQYSMSKSIKWQMCYVNPLVILCYDCNQLSSVEQQGSATSAVPIYNVCRILDSFGNNINVSWQYRDFRWNNNQLRWWKNWSHKICYLNAYTNGSTKLPRNVLSNSFLYNCKLDTRYWSSIRTVVSMVTESVNIL